jgi:hypothetical protein
LKSFFRINLKGILWSVFILILISIPGSFLPDVPHYLDLFKPDKLIHLFLFSVYVFLWINGLEKEGGNIIIKRNAVFIAILSGAILGGCTEIIQYFFIPGRRCSVYDFIANVLGCFVGWGLFRLSTLKKNAPHP